MNFGKALLARFASVFIDCTMHEDEGRKDVIDVLKKL
jgi:hypothetical protein